MTPPQSGHTTALEVFIVKIPEDGLVVATEVEPGLLPLPQEGAVTVESPLHVCGLLTPVGRQVHFQGELRGTVTVPCSRCLDMVRDDIAVEVRAAFFPPTSAASAHEESRLALADELDLYTHDGVQIDLKPLVRDQVVLAFPVQPLCREDCAGLCQICGVNRNEQPCACQGEHDNSPFTILKRLRFPESS